MRFRRGMEDKIELSKFAPESKFHGRDDIVDEAFDTPDIVTPDVADAVEAEAGVIETVKYNDVPLRILKDVLDQMMAEETRTPSDEYSFAHKTP